MNSYFLYVFLTPFLGVLFLIKGMYSLSSHRVWGRTWEKYMGGWVYKADDPFIYWNYTVMYLFVGAILLIGCAIVGLMA